MKLNFLYKQKEEPLYMDSTYIITIDGPSASGKSTLARDLAGSLGWTFLETGALYRAVALAVMEANLLGKDPKMLGEFAWGLDVRVELDKRINRVFLGPREVTESLREVGVGSVASDLSAIPEVRRSLNSLQKCLGENGALVTEGRDQGSAIFPMARLKFFLTANAEIRASRRYADLVLKNTPISYEEVLSSIIARDHSDSTRKDSPLVEPEGSVKVDSTNMSPKEVLELMKNKAFEVFGNIFPNRSDIF
jgi:cytidylate kinase